MIAELNFVGNAIDLRSIPVDTLTAWIDPSFEYAGNRFFRFCDLVSDEEMFKPKLDHVHILIMKKGSASNLTIGCLNTIRAFVRTYSIDGQSGKMSKEVCVLPRNSKSGTFSGDRWHW